MIKIRNKKGQVMIWVILAIALVASMILFFTIDRHPIITTQRDFNANNYIESCVREHVNDAVNEMIPHGGFIEPVNFKVYDDIKIEYLCENIGNYLPCVNQHPMLLNEMKLEIKNYIEPRVEQCFADFKREIESRNGNVEYGPMNIEVSLGPDRVYTNIARRTTITQNGETTTADEYNFEIVNPLYDLGNVAIEIASQEAKYCYFEYVGYMILYPRFSIEKFAMSDSTKIYQIKDKKTNKELNIAIRSCAIPAGI